MLSEKIFERKIRWLWATGLGVFMTLALLAGMAANRLSLASTSKAPSCPADSAQITINSGESSGSAVVNAPTDLVFVNGSVEDVHVSGGGSGDVAIHIDGSPIGHFGLPGDCTYNTTNVGVSIDSAIANKESFEVVASTEASDDSCGYIADVVVCMLLSAKQPSDGDGGYWGDKSGKHLALKDPPSPKPPFKAPKFKAPKFPVYTQPKLRDMEPLTLAPVSYSDTKVNKVLAPKFPTTVTLPKLPKIKAPKYPTTFTIPKFPKVRAVKLPTKSAYTFHKLPKVRVTKIPTTFTLKPLRVLASKIPTSVDLITPPGKITVEKETGKYGKQLADKWTTVTAKARQLGTKTLSLGNPKSIKVKGKTAISMANEMTTGMNTVFDYMRAVGDLSVIGPVIGTIIIGLGWIFFVITTKMIIKAIATAVDFFFMVVRMILNIT